VIIQRPLFWHQGLFLQPHHFQLLDLTAQSRLSPFQDFLMPYFWGVWELEIHRAALGNRSFNALKGQFLMPDGTHIVFPGNALIEPRAFDEAWVEGGKPFTIFIGLRKWNYSKENVTVLPELKEIGEVSTRFATTADPEEAADLHQPGPAATVGRLYHVLRVFWET